LNFGLLGHIADVITHAKFCDNRFRGFGVLIPPILPFSIGIAGCPYNSVSTTVLHCDVAKTGQRLCIPRSLSIFMLTSAFIIFISLT